MVYNKTIRAFNADHEIEMVTYQVEINELAIEHMAMKAAKAKTSKSTDGPIRVKVIRREASPSTRDKGGD